MIKIEKLISERVEAAAALEKENLKTAWSEKSIEDCIGSESLRYITASVDEVLAGICSYSLVCGEGQLINLAVAEQFRRHKIGGGLLGAAIADAVNHKAENFTLEVEPDNKGAIALYESFGFETVGRRKNFYPDGSDAICMTKKL